MINSHRDVGRRLYAAVLSAHYQMGMDYALEHYVPEELDAGWGDLGAILLSALNTRVVEQMAALRRGNTPAQKGG
jgi:hypothetical protein